MSKFSDKLKQLIEDSEVKIYQLAKKAELDRTTIQRSISGERLPSFSFVEKLVEYLRLSPTERDELFDLYSISKIGEKVYVGRKYIKEMIEGLATVTIEDDNSLNPKKNISFAGNILIEDNIYEGQYLVNNMIRAVIENEVFNTVSREIYISVPFRYHFLSDLLCQLYLVENGNINLKNITRFNKISAYHESNYNLEILSHVIPFAFSAGNGYQLYYYYDNYDASCDIAALMPYYILTSNRLITLSSDFTSAILYSNESIINIYKRKFDLAITKSTPFIRQHYSCDDLLLAYLESLNNAGIISHVLEPQPCFAWYYTEDLIQSHLVTEIANRDIILEQLCNYYAKCRNCDNRPMSLFSVEGLGFFAATGILSDLPTQFATPFTVEERIMLLEHLKNDIVSSEYQVLAVNPLKFAIPMSSIQLYATKGVDIFKSNNNGIISSAYIAEKSIAEAFFDFFESLPESGLVYSKEETVTIINHVIEQCKSALLVM